MIDATEVLLIIISALISISTGIAVMFFRQILAELVRVRKDNVLQWRTIGRIDREVGELRGEVHAGGD